MAAACSVLLANREREGARASVRERESSARLEGSRTRQLQFDALVEDEKNRCPPPEKKRHGFGLNREEKKELVIWSH
jgi:hypothetical protein